MRVEGGLRGNLEVCALRDVVTVLRHVPKHVPDRHVPENVLAKHVLGLKKLFQRRRKIGHNFF